MSTADISFEAGRIGRKPASPSHFKISARNGNTAAALRRNLPIHTPRFDTLEIESSSGAKPGYHQSSRAVHNSFIKTNLTANIVDRETYGPDDSLAP
jgi:hypothetical protein